MGSRSQCGRNKAPRTAEHKRQKCVVSHRSGGQKSEVKAPPGAGSFRDHEGGPGPASLAAGGLPAAFVAPSPAALCLRLHEVLPLGEHHLQVSPLCKDTCRVGLGANDIICSAPVS